MYSGLSVGEVASSTVMTEAVAKELNVYWPMERELLASILEMLHVLVLTTQAAYGGKSLPKPLHVQRPFEGQSQATARGGHPNVRPDSGSSATVISMSEFVRRDTQGTL